MNEDARPTLLGGYTRLPTLNRLQKSQHSHLKYKRIAEDDWEIEAHCPGADIQYISGFKSKAEIDEWLEAAA